MKNIVALMDATNAQEKLLAKQKRNARLLEIRRENIEAAHKKIKQAKLDIEREERLTAVLLEDAEDYTMAWENLEQAKQQLERPRESWTELTDDEYETQCYMLRDRIAQGAKAKPRSKSGLAAINGGF